MEKKLIYGTVSGTEKRVKKRTGCADPGKTLGIANSFMKLQRS